MKRPLLRHGLMLAAIATLVWETVPLAQIPDEFENLKVFPKDIGKEELLHEMREISGALGVRCTFCHYERVPGDHRSIDWASDELKHKKTARGMLRMVLRINGDLLPAATGEAEESEGHQHGAQVSCVTCHRGLENPATLQEVILKVADKEGIEAAIARYRELREQYYGSGSYDFGPQPLAKAAESLGQDKGDLDGALALIELDLEMNPLDADLHAMKAQLLLSKGDQAGARASAGRALELEPDNRAAQRLLEQLK